MTVYIAKEEVKKDHQRWLGYIDQDMINRMNISIDNIPTEDVAPVIHAKWERVDKNKVRCTNCEIIHLIAQYPHGEINYCPNCGAKMDKE